MNNLVRSIMMVTLVVLAVAGSVFVTLHAAEPNSEAPAPRAKPRAPAPIVDEPTVAPDSQESADNSVAFPADI